MVGRRSFPFGRAYFQGFGQFQGVYDILNAIYLSKEDIFGLTFPSPAVLVDFINFCWDKRGRFPTRFCVAKIWCSTSKSEGMIGWL